MENRITWVDNLKAIGIFLVVLGHNTASQKNMDWMSTWIYSFHIPLFFFISGYLFNKKRYNNFKSFLIKKLKTLLVPYFIFSCITYLLWLLIMRNLGKPELLSIPWWKPLVGIFYSNGHNDWLAHNQVLWFLTCLFIIEMAFYYLSRIDSKTRLLLVMLLFGTLGALDSLFIPVRLPWSMDVAFTASVYYGIGYLIRGRMVECRFNKSILVLISISFLALNIALSLLNGRTDMMDNHYGNFIYFYLAAWAGILSLALCSKSFNNISVLQYIGENTIIILALHLLAHSFINAFLKIVIHFPIVKYESSVVYQLCISMMQIILLLPAIYIITRYFPAIIGRKKFIIV